MKKINKKSIIIYIFIFLITCIIFLPFISGHYATDTYNIINKGYKEYAIKYSLNDGRPFMCLISLIAEKINMPIQAYIITLTIIALLISCISVIKLKNLIIKYKTDKAKISEYIVLAISYIIIFNFAFLENMQFAECAVMALSILVDIIIAQIIVEREKNYIPKSIVLTVISVLLYQGTINWLITITFFLSIIKENKINIQVIKNVLLTGICICIGYVVNLIQIKITGAIFNLSQTRMGNIKNVFYNFKYILKNIYAILLNTYYLFPKYTLYIYTFGILIYEVCFESRNNIQLNILLLLVVCIGAVFAPNIITLSAFGTGRMAFSIGAMIGLIIMYIYCNLEQRPKTHLRKIILYIIMISYVIVSLGYSMLIMYNHKKVNTQDKQECELIGEWIKEYEESENVEVKDIVFIYNNHSKRYYKNIKNHSALCYKALRTEWARIGAINYYNNRDFKDLLIEKNKSVDIGYYKNYFYDKTWNKLDREQLVFDGETLYYCLY